MLENGYIFRAATYHRTNLEFDIVDDPPKRVQRVEAVLLAERLLLAQCL